MASETIRVFVPPGKPATAVGHDEAARPQRTGSAFVIGLLDNHKHNSGRVLERLALQLRDKYDVFRLPGDA